MADHIDVQIPGVYSLTGCLVRALESGRGEGGYVVRLGRPDGTTANFIASAAELQNLRTEIEKAVLAGVLGATEHDA